MCLKTMTSPSTKSLIRREIVSPFGAVTLLCTCVNNYHLVCRLVCGTDHTLTLFCRHVVARVGISSRLYHRG